MRTILNFYFTRGNDLTMNWNNMSWQDTAMEAEFKSYGPTHPRTRWTFVDRKKLTTMVRLTMRTRQLHAYGIEQIRCSMTKLNLYLKWQKMCFLPFGFYFENHFINTAKYNLWIEQIVLILKKQETFKYEFQIATYNLYSTHHRSSRKEEKKLPLITEGPEHSLIGLGICLFGLRILFDGMDKKWLRTRGWKVLPHPTPIHMNLLTWNHEKLLFRRSQFCLIA